VRSRRATLLVPLLALAAVVAVDTVATAEEPSRALPLVVEDLSQPFPPAEPDYVARVRNRWVWDQLTAVRVNPLGAAARFRSGYRVQLTNRAGALFDESNAAVKLVTEITPSYATVGGRVELQPLTILQLAAQYELIGSFATFFNTMSFPAVTSDYSDRFMRAHRPDTYATRGDVVTLEALVQAKVENIAVRNQSRAVSQRMNLHPGDRFFYHSTLDVLFPNGGWTFINELDLLWLFPFRLKLGARHTVTRAFYDDFLDPTDAAGAVTPTHRVGLVAAYSFFEKKKDEGVRYNAPTLALLAQWWVRHPYRTGAESSAALPYIVLAFAHRGDFLP